MMTVLKSGRIIKENNSRNNLLMILTVLWFDCFVGKMMRFFEIVYKERMEIFYLQIDDIDTIFKFYLGKLSSFDTELNTTKKDQQK